MENAVDYSAVLEDLKAKRAKLDAAIEAIEQMAGQPSSAGVSTPVALGGAQVTLRSDSFFGMGISDAAVKYLGIVKAPKDTRTIMHALEQGGLTHSSKNFYGTLFTSLTRRESNEGDVTRVKKGEWGLSVWYPGLRKGKKNGDKEEPESDVKPPKS